MLTGVGLAASFDLATGLAGDGTTDLSETLSNPEGFNFPVGEKVTGVNEVTFNITKFVPLLNIYPGELHQFKITVVDKNGNSKDMTLKFQS